MKTSSPVWSPSFVKPVAWSASFLPPGAVLTLFFLFFSASVAALFLPNGVIVPLAYPPPFIRLRRLSVRASRWSYITSLPFHGLEKWPSILWGVAVGGKQV